jgi:NADH-quinone oxidoreductase subunit J
MAVAGLAGTGLVTAVAAIPTTPTAPLPDQFGTVASVGVSIFSGGYLLPFEVVSALLTVAVVGAVVLAKREI